jgi:hypothetical protein
MSDGLGFITSIAFGLLCFALQHLYTCFTENLGEFLIVGAIFFPCHSWLGNLGMVMALKTSLTHE